MTQPTHTLPQRICLTGGGTAGHVMPHLALLPSLVEAHCQILYIGAHHGIEKKLMADHPVTFHSITTGKLRRYFHWKTFVMPFAVGMGFLQALWHLWRFKPQLVFSKGGYVALPVVYAAWVLRIPCIAHESDTSLGLTNRLCLPFIQTLCLGFEATAKQIKTPGKAVYTGIPVRPGLQAGSREAGLTLTGLQGDRPIALIFGGSLGARAINQTVCDALDALLPITQVIHIAGPGQARGAARTGYVAYDFVTDALPDLMACADIAITRAGANTLAEWLSLAKPSILIPLPATASRGDQLLNAAHFKEKGYAMVLPQEALSPQHLCDTVKQCLETQAAMGDRLRAANNHDAISEILQVFKKAVIPS